MRDDRSQVVLSWSGGKDSSLALHALRSDPRYNVVALLTSVTSVYDRVSIHGVRRQLLEEQAQAANLPVYPITLDQACSNDTYEQAFLETLALVERDLPLVRHLAFGDLYLEDVRAYRERLLERTTLTPLFPLWGRNTSTLAREFIALGFQAHLVCVDTQLLGGEFSGRPFDQDLLDALPPGVDPCGEGGEFHTFVSSGPIFSTPLRITHGEVVLRDGRFSYCDLLPFDSANETAP